MLKRVTVMIDDTHDKTIRNIQATRMVSEMRHVSYSKILNEVITAGINSRRVRHGN